MLDFFKTFIQGIVYTIFSPFILLYLLIYAIYSLFVFFYIFIRRIIAFFKGEDMKVVMRVDKAAEIILKGEDTSKEEVKKEEPVREVQVTSTTTIKENNTTIVQPIIIERVLDQNGNVKDTHYIAPPTGVPTQGIEYRDVKENVIENNSAPLISDTSSPSDDKEVKHD